MERRRATSLPITNVHGGGAFRSHPISGVAATDYLRVSDPSSPYSEQVIINATMGFSTFSSAFVYAGTRARASPPSSPSPSPTRA